MDKKKSSSQIDMLNGNLIKNIILFALPLAASSILQQLFNSADVAVVGRFAGKNALAAVGSNSTVIALFVNIFAVLSVGANVLVAKFIGQKSKEKISGAVHTIVAFSMLCGLVIMVAGLIGAKWILTLISTPSDVLGLAVLYLRIYFVGMPFIIVYNFGAAILRSKGDTKRPMYTLIVSGITNVILNIILVVGFNLGVAGVAISTVVSNIISSSVILYLLMNEEEYMRLDIKKIRIEKEYLFQMLRIGMPAALQSGVFSVSNVVIQTGINSFGRDAIAGSSTGLNFEYFTYFVVNAFAQAAVTFTSQNYGAGNLKKCKKIFWIAMIEGMCFTAMLSIIFTVGGNFFVSLYTKDAVVMAYALIRMHHVMMIEFLVATYEISGGVLRGMGCSLLPAVLTVFGSVCFRIAWIFTVFKKWHTYDMLMNVYPVSWVITGTMVLLAYFIYSSRHNYNKTFLTVQN